MSLTDRIVPLCDLLLGAAYADEHFKDRERQQVKATLTELTGAPLSPELEQRITSFDLATFDLARSASELADDAEDDRKRVLALVAALNDADDELDLAEDAYLRAVAKALALPESALAGLTIEVEIEELRQYLAKVRKVPPPPPLKK